LTFGQIIYFSAEHSTKHSEGRCLISGRYKSTKLQQYENDLASNVSTFEKSIF
jgi:hypothetical protein